MALQPPRPQSGVIRDDVPEKVGDMLLDTRVRWIAIVFDGTVNDIDTFMITPHIVDPTEPRA